MVSPSCVPLPSSGRIAIIVARSRAEPVLCPFFGKCDGVWTIEAETNAVKFHGNPKRTSDALCDLILAIRPTRLICSFIGKKEKRRLSDAGVDVRLGSCACPIDELVSSFEKLAAA